MAEQVSLRLFTVLIHPGMFGVISPEVWIKNVQILDIFILCMSILSPVAREIECTAVVQSLYKVNVQSQYQIFVNPISVFEKSCHGHLFFFKCRYTKATVLLLNGNSVD